MGLLKRSEPPLYDEHMPYFTVAQADEFRRLVARSFAAVGRDVDVYPDRIEDRGGTTLGLSNIGALCAGAAAGEWPKLIDELTARGTTSALVALGRDNLRTLLTGDAIRAETVGQARRGAYTAVCGESLFTASLALVLPETLARFSGDDDWGRAACSSPCPRATSSSTDRSTPRTCGSRYGTCSRRHSSGSTAWDG